MPEEDDGVFFRTDEAGEIRVEISDVELAARPEPRAVSPSPIKNPRTPLAYSMRAAGEPVAVEDEEEDDGTAIEDLVKESYRVAPRRDPTAVMSIDELTQKKRPPPMRASDTIEGLGMDPTDMSSEIDG